MTKITQETHPLIFRSYEDAEFVKLGMLKDDVTLDIPFRKPGMIQVAHIVKLVLNAFTPKEINAETLSKLDIAEVNNMSKNDIASLTQAQINKIYNDSKENLDEENKFLVAVDSMGIVVNESEEVSEEAFEQIGKNLYTALFFKDGNVDIIEMLVKDCFDLEARALNDDVLMILIGKLITYLLDLTENRN